MSLKYKLGQREELLLRSRLNGEEVEYTFAFDLNERESFIDGHLAITQTRFFVIVDGELIMQRKIDSGKDYKMREYSSAGLLEYNDAETGETFCIARYTLGGLKRFAYAEGILNAFSEHKPVRVYDRDIMDFCPVCGSKFVHNTKTCPKCNNKFSVLKRLSIALKNNWYLYAMILASLFINSLFKMLQPYASRNLIDKAIRPMADYTADPSIVGAIAPNINTIIFYVAMLGLYGVGEVIMRIVRGYLSNEAGARVSRDFRSIVYEKVQALSVRFMDNKQIGDLMNRINNDTDRIKGFISDSAVPFLNEFILMITSVVTIMAFNWRLGLIILIPVPFLFFVAKIRFGPRFHAQWIKMDKMNSTLNNILSGIRVVKAFGQEEREIKRFCKDADSVRQITTKNEQFFYTIFPLIRFAVGFGNYFVLLYCGSLIIKDQFTIGEMVQFSAYASYLYNRLDWLTSLPRHLNDAINAANRIYEVIDEKIEIDDMSAPLDMEIKGSVKLQEVTFGYLSYKPVLKNLNLDIKQGEMIGIVGHSGAGKSTFINLIMRLYDADEGAVLIDDTDLRELSVNAYKNQIGVVLQEAFLFSGTVRENILYSKPEATFEEIITAAKIANAHDFIVSLPNGYDTKVGEKGHSLSGGERQRISIARAVLNNPKILILDEATASVDTETEQAIQEAFSRLIKGRTTFAIAHRLSTLKNADRIMVVDKGELAEFGTHKELMDITDGIYHGLVMAQRRMSKIKAL